MTTEYFKIKSKRIENAFFYILIVIAIGLTSTLLYLLFLMIYSVLHILS